MSIFDEDTQNLERWCKKCGNYHKELKSLNWWEEKICEDCHNEM